MRLDTEEAHRGAAQRRHCLKPVCCQGFLTTALQCTLLPAQSLMSRLEKQISDYQRERQLSNHKRQPVDVQVRQ